MGHAEWREIRKQLVGVVGKESFRFWIEPMEFVRVEDGVALFRVPTTFAGTYVNKNYADVILSMLTSDGAPVQRLAFQVSEKLKKARGSSVSAPPPSGIPGAGTGTGTALPNSGQAFSRPAPDPDETESGAGTGTGLYQKLDGGLKSTPLDPKLNFESFVVGAPNEMAFTAAKHVSSNRGEPTMNPLVLYGGVGLGKTHLMNAIALDLTSRPDKPNVLYLSAEQFMYHFVQALRHQKMMDFKVVFRSVDVLIVDDVQFIADKHSTQDEFFHTFNALVEQKKQIVLSADRAPGEITDFKDRVRSRLQSGLEVDLHPTDFELRLGILQTKIEQHRARNPSLRVEDGVLEALAQRISTNVRVLEGALNRLVLFSTMSTNSYIDMNLMQSSLGEMMRASSRKISLDEIQRKVAEHYNVRLGDMLGPRRIKSLVIPRHVAMYLCKKLTSRSLPEIGRHFGNRDHTTIMNGIRKIEKMQMTDDKISDDLEMLRRDLEA